MSTKLSVRIVVPICRFFSKLKKAVKRFENVEDLQRFTITLPEEVTGKEYNTDLQKFVPHYQKLEFIDD